MILFVVHFKSTLLKWGVLVERKSVRLQRVLLGRIEKGNSEVPVEMLKSAWQEYELSDSVRLEHNIVSWTV